MGLLLVVWLLISLTGGRRYELRKKPNATSPPFGSFLLIVCTQHVVTAANAASSVGYSDVPAYSRMLIRCRHRTGQSRGSRLKSSF